MGGAGCGKVVVVLTVVVVGIKVVEVVVVVVVVVVVEGAEVVPALVGEAGVVDSEGGSEGVVRGVVSLKYTK